MFGDVSVFKTVPGAVIDVLDSQDEFGVAKVAAELSKNIRQIYIKFEKINQHDIYR